MAKEKESESALADGTVCTTGIPDSELTDEQIRARLNFLSSKGGQMTDAEDWEHTHLIALSNREMLSALSRI